jgi:hypothetical protein
VGAAKKGKGGERGREGGRREGGERREEKRRTHFFFSINHDFSHASVHDETTAEGVGKLVSAFRESEEYSAIEAEIGKEIKAAGTSKVKEGGGRGKEEGGWK